MLREILLRKVNSSRFARYQESNIKVAAPVINHFHFLVFCCFPYLGVFNSLLDKKPTDSKVFASYKYKCT